MEGRKTDRRILRTRRMIDEAMMALLAEKSISEISITALCERADINRNTFFLSLQFSHGCDAASGGGNDREDQRCAVRLGLLR